MTNIRQARRCALRRSAIGCRRSKDRCPLRVYATLSIREARGGLDAGLKAFTAAVLDGVENIPGAMLGGVIIGLLETFGAAYISGEWKSS